MRNTLCVLLLASATWVAPNDECDCPILKIYGGWCDTCNVGYIAGLKIPSKMLFEVLHNHGHDVDRRFMSCDSCRKEIEADGFCEKCRIGYLEGQAYFSMLAYQLARGKAKRPEQITCDKCRASASPLAKSSEARIGRGGGGSGEVADLAWCDKCQVGMLGNVVIADRAAFEAALPEFRRLLLGLAHLKKCESCAVAIASNGMCPDCRMVYVEGQGTQLPAPPIPRPDRQE